MSNPRLSPHAEARWSETAVFDDSHRYVQHRRVMATFLFCSRDAAVIFCPCRCGDVSACGRGQSPAEHPTSWMFLQLYVAASCTTCCRGRRVSSLPSRRELVWLRSQLNQFLTNFNGLVIAPLLLPSSVLTSSQLLSTCSRVHSVSFLRRSSSPLLRVQRLLSTCSRGFPFRVPSSSPCPLGMGFLLSYGLSMV